jgi:hypothetical protein
MAGKGGKRSTTWQAGKVPRSPGRPKGSERASIVALLDEIARKHPGKIRDAFLAGIEARPPRSFAYLQLLTHYLDGKPKDTLALEGEVGINVSAVRESLARRFAALVDAGTASDVAE